MNTSPERLKSAEAEWLYSPQYTVRYDPHKAFGADVVAKIAPGVFMVSEEEGRLYTRFGKVIGMDEGKGSIVPVPEELLHDVLMAAAADPNHGVYIDAIPQNRFPAELWKDFFGAAIESAEGELGYLFDSATCVLTGAKPEMDLDAASLKYIASILDPSPEVTTLPPTSYDAFDVLGYLNAFKAGDLEGRKAVADEFRAALDSYTTPHKMLTIIEHAFEYFPSSRNSSVV